MPDAPGPPGSAATRGKGGWDGQTRLEAFSDAVIVIMIMVPELRAPEGGGLEELRALAFVNAWIAVAIAAGVALKWLVPDRRIERTLAP